MLRKSDIVPALPLAGQQEGVSWFNREFLRLGEAASTKYGLLWLQVNLWIRNAVSGYGVDTSNPIIRWLCFVIARGVCAHVFERVVTDHELVFSPHIIGELERVMVAKLHFDASRVKRTIAVIERAGRMVDPVPLSQPVCRDSDDEAVLALARSAEASCVVTGDDDLLILDRFQGIPIISPREFLAGSR